MDLMTDSWVSPDGKSYPATGGHPTWAHNNYAEFGIPFIPAKSLDYEPTTDPRYAFRDEDGNIALDLFLDEGWVRVASGSGVEIRSLYDGNIDLIKRILANMAKRVPGRTFYVDQGGPNPKVPISFTGRPDFSELDAYVSGQAVTAMRSNYIIAQTGSSQDSMVSPDGKSYPTGGSHAKWAFDNYTKFGIPFGHIPIEDEDGDDILDHFLDAGWIRVKHKAGVEVLNLDTGNIDLVKRILSNMAKESAGTILAVDVTSSNQIGNIPVSMTGRPDFSELDAYVGRQEVVANWVRSNCRLAQNTFSECPDFGSMLGLGSKGMLLSDGNWVTWSVDRNGYPEHDEVLEKCFKFSDIQAKATHWRDGILYIWSDEPFSQQTQSIIDSYHGNRGSGSHITIDSMDGGWSGDFRKYQKDLWDHERAMEPVETEAWISGNCRLAGHEGGHKGYSPAMDVLRIQHDEIIRLINEGLTLRDIAKKFGVSKNITLRYFNAYLAGDDQIRNKLIENRNKKRSKRRWIDPENREKMTGSPPSPLLAPALQLESAPSDSVGPRTPDLKRKQKMKELWADPELRKKMQNQTRELWKNPEYREKMRNRPGREVAKKQWEDPEFRKMQSEKAKKQWEDPEFRKMQSEKPQNANFWPWLYSHTPEKQVEIMNGMKAKTYKQPQASTASWLSYICKFAQQQTVLDFDETGTFTDKPNEHDIYDTVIETAPEGVVEEEYVDGFFHVTTNLPAVLQWGALKSRRQLGDVPGLGGGWKNEAPGKISITHSLQNAEHIYGAMQFAAEVAHGFQKPSSIFYEVLSRMDVPDDFIGDGGPIDIVLQEYAPIAMKNESQEGLENELNASITTPDQAYNFMIQIEDAAATVYTDNPSGRVGFTAPFDTFSQIDPFNIGIVQLQVRKDAKLEHVPLEMELRAAPDDVRLAPQAVIRRPTHRLLASEDA